MGAELCFNYHCNGCREVIDVPETFPLGNTETGNTLGEADEGLAGSDWVLMVVIIIQ